MVIFSVTGIFLTPCHPYGWYLETDVTAQYPHPQAHENRLLDL
jgi:hypothetical protein